MAFSLILRFQVVDKLLYVHTALTETTLWKQDVENFERFRKTLWDLEDEYIETLEKQQSNLSDELHIEVGKIQSLCQTSMVKAAW